VPQLKPLKNLDRLIEGGQAIEMVVLLRLAPLPKGIVCYFLGTTVVSWRDFLLGTTIVNLPVCLLDVSIGAGAANVKGDSPLTIIAFILFVVCFVGLLIYIGKRAEVPRGLPFSPRALAHSLTHTRARAPLTPHFPPAGTAARV
jgi:uncharacterized membrane protein YdjX (TVP38/TMEM64 family)